MGVGVRMGPPQSGAQAGSSAGCYGAPHLSEKPRLAGMGAKPPMNAATGPQSSEPHPSVGTETKIAPCELQSFRVKRHKKDDELFYHL
jgi:hypothetical protein